MKIFHTSKCDSEVILQTVTATAIGAMGLSGGWSAVFGLDRGGLKAKLPRSVLIKAGERKRLAVELHGLVYKLISRDRSRASGLWDGFRRHVDEGCNVDLDALDEIGEQVVCAIRGTCELGFFVCQLWCRAQLIPFLLLWRGKSSRLFRGRFLLLVKVFTPTRRFRGRRCSLIVSFEQSRVDSRRSFRGWPRYFSPLVRLNVR